MMKAVSAEAPPTLRGRIIRGPRGSATLPTLMVLALLQALSAHAQPPSVLQRGYDANVSGANLSETTLNTSNVVPGSFGLVFTLSVNDTVMAQPLYMPGVTINGTVHNVVYVATMSDTLYAFDADVGGAPLWQTNLATFENATPVPMAQFAYSGNSNITGNLGILSTPVIDPSTPHTLYAVACTLENGTLVYRLHAVDITTGTPAGRFRRGDLGQLQVDDFRRPQPVAADVAGTRRATTSCSDSALSSWRAPPISIAAGSWLTTRPRCRKPAFSPPLPAAMAAPGCGNPVVRRPLTARGTSTSSPAMATVVPATTALITSARALLKLNPAAGLGLVDWFTPSNWSALDNSDLDLASAGPMLVPGTSLIAGGGKASVLYVLNTGGLGHETANDSGAIQKIALASGSMRGGPVYWSRAAANGGPLMYDWGSSDALKAFPFNGSTFATTASATGTVTESYPGGILTLSANGSTPGSAVLWATVSTSGNAFNGPTPGALYAFDASNVATALWNSNTNPADSLGTFAKLVPPTVANGRVYVATGSQKVAVYGLNTPPPAAAAPTFTPAAGTYTTAQSVTLASTTPAASFFYTTNGTTPTTASTPYNGSIPVSSSMTIEAIATASGFSPSPVASAAYVINTGTTTEVPLTGSVNVDGIVANGSAVPKGGLDNDGNAYSATLLGSSLTWNGNTYAFGSAGVADAVSNTTLALPAGSYTTLSLLGTGVNGNQPNQTFTVNYSDGSSTSFTQSLSDWFTPQNYAGETKVLQMAYRLTSTRRAR